MPKTTTPTASLMERVALTRLRRFNRLAAAAEGSDSPIWQRLARRAAHSAMRDYLLTASIDRVVLADPTTTAHAA